MEFMRAVVANCPQIHSCFRISNNGGDRSDLKENDTVQKFTTFVQARSRTKICAQNSPKLAISSETLEKFPVLSPGKGVLPPTHHLLPPPQKKIR